MKALVQTYNFVYIAFTTQLANGVDVMPDHA